MILTLKKSNDETNCSSDGSRGTGQPYHYDISTRGGGKSLNPKIFWNGGQIPDPAFRAYVLENFDTDRNGRISEAEAGAVTEINLPTKWDDSMQGKPVISLDGIQFFSNLRKLVCAANAIVTLDLSQNRELEELDCYANNLTRLNLSTNTKLKKLTTGLSDADGFLMDNLSQIILPQRGVLEELDCGGHKLTALDLSGQTHLKKAVCNECPELTSLNLTGCGRLEELYCGGSDKLTQLDLSDAISLKTLSCYCNKLTSLDVSHCPKLTVLDVGVNQLSVLDLGNNPQLKELKCGFNQIRKLDISVCPEIRSVYCAGNPLLDFNFSGTKLYDLDISVDRITTWSYAGAAEPGRVTIYNGDKRSGTICNLLEQLEKVKARKNEEIQRREAEAARAKAARAEAKQKAAEYKRLIMPYLTRDDWKGADDFAAKALTELPEGDAFLCLIRAKAYFKQNLDFEVDDNENMTEYFRAYRSEAEHLAELCRKSVACDSSNGNEAYFYRGMAYIILGRAEDAVTDFRRCAQGNEPLKAACYYNAGTAYKNAGRYRLALEQFKLARQYYTATDKKEKCLKRIKECQQKIDG